MVAPPTPPPPFSSYGTVRHSFHHASVRLETLVDRIHNRREEDGVEQKGREYAPLTKALFHSEPPQAHPAVEPHACTHAIVELTIGRDHILWYAKTDDYSSKKGSVNEVLRFGKVDKVDI